jgi:nucleotide-binding universal stress UspA family protein
MPCIHGIDFGTRVGVPQGICEERVMFHRILLPVDLTEKSLSAVNVAREFAVAAAADVTLLHVIETIEHVPFEEIKAFYERLEQSARKTLQEFSKKLQPHNMRVVEEIVYGHRTKEIIDYAVANQIDLIVLASHRIDPAVPARGWSSISYSVAILSPCPVLLVK